LRKKNRILKKKEMNMNIEIVNVLYYKCYNASLLGDFNKMSMYYNLLKNGYNNSKDKTSFKTFLDKEKMQNLDLVKQQIKIGKCLEIFEEFRPIEQEIKMSESEIEEEKLIVKKVAKNQNMLEPFLGKEIKLISIEYT
jgi:hypothetical protein